MTSSLLFSLHTGPRRRGGLLLRESSGRMICWRKPRFSQQCSQKTGRRSYNRRILSASHQMDSNFLHKTDKLLQSNKVGLFQDFCNHALERLVRCRIPCLFCHNTISCCRRRNCHHQHHQHQQHWAGNSIMWSQILLLDLLKGQAQKKLTSSILQTEEQGTIIFRRGFLPCCTCSRWIKSNGKY